MARNISQIYAEAIYNRNNYLQLTELNSGRTKSKMSILNMITYVMAVLIHTYEVALDVFQVNIATIISNRINGTAPYYVAISKLFQYDPIMQCGDTLIFNESNYKVEYETVNETHRIVTQACWEEYAKNDSIILKVCKNNTNSTEINGGTLYMPLSDPELTAFKEYISNVKFVGASIYCISNPADIISIVTSNTAPIYYNDRVVTQAQALENIKMAIKEYVKSLDYGGYIHYQKIIDAIQLATGIEDISNNIEVNVSLYNSKTGSYDSPISITGRIRSGSGYIKFIDENGNQTLNSLVLKPNSQRSDVESDIANTSALSLDNAVWVKNGERWEKVNDVKEERTYTQKKKMLQ